MNSEIENTREMTKVVEKQALSYYSKGKGANASPLLGTLRSVTIALIGLGLAIVIVLVSLLTLKHNYFDPVDKNDTTPVRVEIPLGSSLSSIADTLYEKEIIHNTAVFKLYFLFSDRL